MKLCVECEWQGPELPGPAAAREIHRALHGLGRRFLEALDPIVAAFVPIKPLENLDFPLPVVPDLEVPRDEVRLVMGGKVVGSAILDGSSLHGEVLDPAAVEDLRRGLLGGVSIRPEFNLNEARFRGEVPPGGRIIQPAPYDPAVLEANRRAIEEELKKGPLFGSRGWQP
ncbi:hypothetical protein PBI_MELONS_64 [Arthrobacter phage Melons]|uniref:Uncharacterized protein n=1 Tax=Arthrobacter phage Melons TaxID=2419962 RepID=A0A3G2KIA5_9CAUD|nr:hypothetical protein PBI_MELONS_64 [Arthrobacter phage Melons]